MPGLEIIDVRPRSGGKILASATLKHGDFHSGVTFERSLSAALLAALEAAPADGAR